MRPLVALLLALAATACAGSQPPVPVVAANAAPDWRAAATEDDRRRVREWRSAWMAALGKASAHRAEIAREGVLLQPDAALDFRAPPPGDYRCRVIKVGAKSAGLLDYVAYPAFGCRIRDEGALLGFEKLDGSQRPIGRLFPTLRPRMVFLGTLQLGDETRNIRYGSDRERDMAGVLERIGDARWRLVFPYPHFESTIDVLELVPA